MICRDVFGSDYCPICSQGRNEEKHTQDKEEIESDDEDSESDDEEDSDDDKSSDSEENTFADEKKWWVHTLRKLQKKRTKIMAEYLTAVSKYKTALNVDDYYNGLNDYETSNNFKKQLSFMELRFQDHIDQNDEVSESGNVEDRLKIQKAMSIEIDKLKTKVKKIDWCEKQAVFYKKQLNQDIQIVMKKLDQIEKAIKEHDNKMPEIHHICMKEFEDKALGKEISQTSEPHWACRKCLEHDSMWRCPHCRAEREKEPEEQQLIRDGMQFDSDFALALEMEQARLLEYQDPLTDENIDHERYNVDNERDDSDNESDDSDDEDDDSIDSLELADLELIFRQDDFNSSQVQQLTRNSETHENSEQNNTSEKDHDSNEGDSSDTEISEDEDESVTEDESEEDNYQSDTLEDDESSQTELNRLHHEEISNRLDNDENPVMSNLAIVSSNDNDTNKNTEGKKNFSIDYSNSELGEVARYFDNDDESQDANLSSMEDSETQSVSSSDHEEIQEIGDFSDSDDNEEKSFHPSKKLRYFSDNFVDPHADDEDTTPKSKRFTRHEIEDMNHGDKSDDGSVSSSDDISGDDDGHIGRESFRNGDEEINFDENYEEDRQYENDKYDKYYYSFLDTDKEIKHRKNRVSTQKEINDRFSIWKSERRKRFDSEYRIKRRNLLKSFGDSGLTIKDYIAKINLLLSYEKPNNPEENSMQDIPTTSMKRKSLWDQPPSPRRRRKSGWDQPPSPRRRRKSGWDQLPSPRRRRKSGWDQLAPNKLKKKSRWDELPSQRRKKSSR